MADTRRISTLIENQLPEFISSDYENFTKVVEKYYEQLESPGQPLDVIQNITKYRDIDYYEKNLLSESSTLVSSITAAATSVTLADASSFPSENGYIKIDDEIIFYQTREGNVLENCSRGVSGNTKLGDLYESSNFVTTAAANHVGGANVQNISNLFLYAIVKNFESDYLASFPEKYLKSDVDKRTLIKNITDFYQAKGTDRSIKFVFNTLISKSEKDKPEIISPKDFTLKTSTSDWITSYSLKVLVLEGDPKTLIGKEIVQQLDPFNANVGFASAVVDNVFGAGGDLYQIALDTSTINNLFDVASVTELTEDFTPGMGPGDRVNVDSTLGWNQQGRFLIGDEEFRYLDKNITQFVIEQRSNNLVYTAGTPVYSYSTVTSGNVKLLVTGVLYNLNPKYAAPYSEEGDLIETIEKGFDTRDPKIIQTGSKNTRWIFSSTNASSNNAGVDLQINKLKAGVQGIFEDENYYYICSNGFPTRAILNADTTAVLKEQKLLKLIRKEAQTTTELYPTTQRDVGIFVDGTIAYSHRDFDQIKFGPINKFHITARGDGYQDPPVILINDVPGKARATLSGEILQDIETIDTTNYTTPPEVTITSGRGGKASAVVTQGRITSLRIDDPGEYYTTAPTVRIIDRLGKGRFAEFKTIIEDGKIVNFELIDGGKFYTRRNVIIDILPVGSGANAESDIVTWTKDRYNKLSDKLDTNNGYYFVNYNPDRGNGYGVCAKPTQLCQDLNDDGSTHSPILGFAYDGNPIYGSYGFRDPLDKNSAISKLKSAYSLKSNRLGGPSKIEYPLGTFIEDYVWVPSTETGKLELDENNGRYCVTPEYPNGTYAYFVSVDDDGDPAFPYILGEKYYALPVDSNYNSDLTQQNVPFNAKRYNTQNGISNGSGTLLKIKSTTPGSVNGVTVSDSPDNFKVGNKFIVNNRGTEGFGASAFVSEVSGRDIVSLDSKSLDPTNPHSVAYLRLISPAYLFENDIITQEDSNFTGRVIGDITNGNNFVLDRVTGTYVPGKKLNSDSNILSLLLDKNSFYTSQSVLSLTDGDDSILGTGRILELVSNQNTVKIELLTGTFIVPEDAEVEYYLQSNTLGDTVGSQVITQTELSKNLEAFSYDDDVALIETDVEHNVGVGSQVDIKLNPDVAQTTTDYYVRKRFYQELTLDAPNFNSTLKDTGVGRGILLNGGLGYTADTYTDVELIFLDQSKVRNGIGAPGDENNARATIVVSDFGGTGFGSVSVYTFTNKGQNYIKGDVLTVADSDLIRNPAELSSQRLAIDVDHVGLSKQDTVITVNQVNKLSTDDLLLIDSEVVKVTAIDDIARTITVQRGLENTKVVDHYDGARLSLYSGKYRFDANSRPLGDGVDNPVVISYDHVTQKIVLAFDYASTSPKVATFSSIFQDDSTPAKTIDISAVNPGEYRLEFSKDVNFATYAANTDIRIQKYYRYKFDTSHSSMLGVFLDFSASRQGNLFTEEKEVSGIQPGNAGSFVALTLGFGPAIVGAPQRRFPVNFDTYYYFIKAGSDVNTDNAALKVIDDPLAGLKSALFTTPKKFAYSIPETPDYDGKGTISYNTTSVFAEGKIISASIDNLGEEYKRTPIIDGCLISPDNEAKITSTIDTLTGSIATITLNSGGMGYVNPKAIVTNGDGHGAEFKVYHEYGRVTRIDLVSAGSGFTYAPTVSVYEEDVQAYFTSSTIGVPKDINVISNGGNFHNDKTIETTYRSAYAVIVDGDIPKFFAGERVTQKLDDGTVFFSAEIAKHGWRKGSNIVRLQKVSGVIDPNISLVSALDPSRNVSIDQVLYTEYEPDVRTYYDNMGRFASDRGKISSRSQRLTDSFFYQDYSYMIQSRTPIDVWRDLIKQTTHPAGFQLFGEVLIDTKQSIEMPLVQEPTTSLTIIELPKVTISSEYKSTVVVNSLITLHDLNVRRGVGSISIDEYDTEGILSKELILQQEFDGRYATKEDYVGPIAATTEAAIDTGSFVYVSYGSAISILPGQYAHWIKFKMISNSDNQPATGPFLGAGNSPEQFWDSNANYTILSNDEYVTTGSGNFDLNLIERMVIGYIPNVGEIDQSSPDADPNLFTFGAVIKTTESDISKIASGFEVGDQITFYENASSFITVEVELVTAPAYDLLLGIKGNGNVIGRRTFTLLDRANNLPYNPYNEQEVFLTLNGVAQEPKKSFIISGSQITFSQAPLGPQYPITGLDLDDTYTTDPTKFLCRAFKFKNDTFNSRYLRKLQDIAPKFDGITTEFDLYWEDGSIVKAAGGEKFLIFMNGVLQRAKTSADTPLGNAYYIKERTEDNQPDAIVFAEAPRNFADDLDDVPLQLDQRESFFGYSVGAYDRFVIDDRLIPYRGTGPYLIFDEVENTVKNITDDRFAYVFVDGVMQSPDAYILNGPNITFRDNLIKFVPETGESIASKVDIISLYGRDVPKTLSFYDFDRTGYTNELTIKLERKITSANGTAEYLAFQNDYNRFDPSSPKNLFTITPDGRRRLIGKFDSIRFDELADGTTSGLSKPDVVANKLTIVALNAANINFAELSYDPLTDDLTDDRVSSLYLTNKSDFSDAISLNRLNQEYSIDISYKTDDEGLRELTRDLPGWLRGSDVGDRAYDVKYELISDIAPGDQILVDGESEPRLIQSIPNAATSRNFRNGETAKYEHFAKVEATNYNGLIRGEGLSVTCTISDGKVNSVGFSDLEWNKRDLKLFFDTGILLQPTAYQYFIPPQIKFVALDGNGGGAKAEVICVNGQVLDVVLTDPGDGYTSPPKAIVTRGYDVIRKPTRVISSTYGITVGTQVASGGSLSVVQTEIALFSEGASSGIFSIISFGGLAGAKTSLDSQKTVEIHHAGVEAGSELRPNTGQIQVKRPVASDVSQATVPGTTQLIITCSIVPPSITAISTIETQELNIDLEIEINRPGVYLFDSEAYSATGAFLDSALSPTATTVYVTNTSLFPSEGKLQIGKEIVSYKSTLFDRFMEVERGVDGSIAQAHPGGQYLRTLPEFTTVLPVGVETIVHSEVSVASGEIKVIEQKGTKVIERAVSFEDRLTEITIRHEEINVIHSLSVLPVLSASYWSSESNTVRMENAELDVHTTTVQSIQTVEQASDRIFEFTRRHEEIDVALDYDIQEEIIIIPPTTQLDGGSEAQAFSEVKLAQGGLAENVTDSIVTTSTETTVITSESNIELITTLQVGTQITKFDGFATITAIPSVVAEPTSEIYVNVAPSMKSMNSLVTSSVATVILATDAAAAVDFARGADGGILGGSSESGPRNTTPIVPVEMISTVVTVIETNVDHTAGGIESTYSVRSHLTEHEGRDKPADIMLQRQTGVIDFFTELVVLETSIVTRN